MRISAKKTLVTTLCILLALAFCGCAERIAPLPADSMVIAYSDEALTGFITQCVAKNLQSAKVYFPDKAADISAKVDKASNLLFENNTFCSLFLKEINWVTGVEGKYSFAQYTFDYNDNISDIHTLLAEDGSLDMPAYSDDGVVSWLTEAVKNGGDSFKKLFSDVPEDIEDRLKALGTSLYANAEFYYLVKNYTLSSSALPNGVLLSANVVYNADTTPLYTLQSPHGAEEIIKLLTQSWSVSTTPVVFYIDDASLTTRQLMDWSFCAMAESGAVLSYCGDTAHCMIYPETGAHRIAKLWIDTAADTAANEQNNSEALAAVQRIAEEIKKKNITGKRELYKAAHDAVLAASVYDMSILDATKSGTMTPEMYAGKAVYGALVQGKTVCTGYAGSFEMLCRALGLECATVHGTQDSEQHVWNAVRIDSQILYVDCTFDDSGSNKYRYFLMDKEKLDKEKYVISENCILIWE